jgi:cardiolipin synthase
MPAARSKAHLYTTHNSITLIRGGKEYFDLLEELINNAEHTLHLQVYIFDEDDTGLRIATALINAAKRKVKVYVLVDGYASQHLSKKFIGELKEGGIHFRWFEPVFRSRHFYFGRRLHHKVAVADACFALVTGINISDSYNDTDEPAWLDWAVHVHGEVAIQLHKICVRVWNRSDWNLQRGFVNDPIAKNTHPTEETKVRVRVNDWVRGRNQISKSYLEMLRIAKDRITIMSSYFLPGRNIKRNMIAAVRRGVKVRVIIAGRSDIVVAKQAERYMYHWLFRHGIEVYEYTKTVLHGKISTYDGKWVTVGSYNLNNLSAFASIELNLDIMNDKFAAKAETALQRVIDEDCIRVVKEEFSKQNGWLHQLWQWTCYQVLQVTLFLFTFYFRPTRD